MSLLIERRKVAVKGTGGKPIHMQRFRRLKREKRSVKFSEVSFACGIVSAYTAHVDGAAAHVKAVAAIAGKVSEALVIFL